MDKKKAILAPIGVLAGFAAFAGIGFGLMNVGMKSMDAWVDDTMVLADAIFSGEAAPVAGQVAEQSQGTLATPAQTAPQAGQIAAATTTMPVPETESTPEPATTSATYTTAEGYTGTVAPEHVVHNGETWVSRTDSSGTPYYRTDVYLDVYNDYIDLADYGTGCYFVAQDGQPIYWDSATGSWTLVYPYEAWVSPF